MRSVQAGSFRFMVKAYRKIGAKCLPDIRAGKARIEWFDHNFKKHDIFGEGATPPNPPSEPEKNAAPDKDFVEKAQDPPWSVTDTFQPFRPDGTPFPAGTFQPCGYGLFHPNPAYRHLNDPKGNLFNWRWIRNLVRFDGRPNITFLDLDFTAPFYCMCVKDKSFKVRLIRLRVDYDSRYDREKPRVVLEATSDGNPADPFTLTDFKPILLRDAKGKVIDTSLDFPKIPGSDWHHAQYSGFVSLTCPCRDKKATEKDGEAETPEDPKGAKGNPKQAPGVPEKPDSTKKSDPVDSGPKPVDFEPLNKRKKIKEKKLREDGSICFAKVEVEFFYRYLVPVAGPPGAFPLPN